MACPPGTGTASVYAGSIADIAGAPTDSPAPAHRVGVHRPARLWPVRSSSEPIELIAAPAPSDDGSSGRWSSLLPMIGSLSMVAFAFIVRSLLSLVVMGFMVLAMVGAGLGTTWAQARRRRRQWEKTGDRYLAHVRSCADRAGRAAEVQRAGLLGLYPDLVGLIEVCESGEGLWERRRSDDDFGSVRLGLGQVAAARPVTMSHHESPLIAPDPDLAEAADRLVASSGALCHAPVVMPLARLGTIAVVGDPQRARDLVGGWLASLVTFHSPADLRVLGYVPVGASRSWDWTKWLPHSREPAAGDGFGRCHPAITTDLTVFAEQTENLVRSRLERRRRAGGASDATGSHQARSYQPGSERGGEEHAVVIVDGYSPGLSMGTTGGLDMLVSHAATIAVTLVVLVATEEEIPAKCDARVAVETSGTLGYLEAGPDGRIETHVVADAFDRSGALALARRLAPLRLASDGMTPPLADSFRLGELLGLPAARTFPAAASWATVASLAVTGDSELLRAPLGRSADGSLLSLDLKEAAAGGMGPHGILVGATGSGKSELLRSFALALAARHSPELLNLLLVDFKGGAAFAELGDLPHTSGLVTNLADDAALIERVQQALTGELTRRQQALLRAGNLDSIRDYHAAQAGGADLPSFAYLVVIVDEFGELLAARPEFIDTFNAIGRLGRSLGMHLLLATQRLDEGRIRGLDPHLRYRLCLRTYTVGESRAVLGTPEAFELPPIPGLGYLKVDTESVAFKAPLVTLPYRAAEFDEAEYRGGPILRPLSLSPSTTLDDTRRRGPSTVSDLQVLVSAMRKQNTAPVRAVWLDPLPESITLGALLARCPTHTDSQVVLGLVDIPEDQAQDVLMYDTKGSGGNLAVAGGPQSGKSTLLATAILSLTQGRSPAQVQVYALDLGGGGLFALAGLPHVGAVVGRGEPDATARLLRDLRALIDERAALLRDDPLHTEVIRRTWPQVFLVIDGLGLLRTALPDQEATAAEIAAGGLQYGVHVIASANRWFDMRPQFLDALGTRLELRLGDPADSGVCRTAALRVPGGRPGRGLSRQGHLVQLAMPSLEIDAGGGAGGAGGAVGQHGPLADAVEQARRKAGPVRAPAISSLPARISSGDVTELALGAGSQPPAGAGFLLGVSEFRCRPVEFDLLGRGNHLLVYGDPGSGRTSLVRRALGWLTSHGPGRVQVHIVDPSRDLLAFARDHRVATYAVNTAGADRLAANLTEHLVGRLPPDDISVGELAGGSHWCGPEHLLVVDDYDVLITASGGPFGALVDLIAHAGDIGLHVLLARRVAGAQRTAFEAFGQRLREAAPAAVFLSGTPDEGPIFSGVSARVLPPGRALFVARQSAPQVVQCCLDDEPPPPHGDGAEERTART